MTARLPSRYRLLLAALPAGGACTGPLESTGEADFSAVVSACASELDAWAPAHTAEDVVARMGAPCASALGESIGFDWEGFGIEPSNPGASDIGAYILTGVLTVVGSDAATVDEILADGELPHVAAVELLRLRDTTAIEGWSSGTDGWFALLRESVSAVRPADAIPGSGGSAGYDNEERTIYVTDSVLGWDRELSNAPLPAYAASVLLHEAAHRVTGPHAPCASNPDQLACDATIEGAYGIQVWWLDDWQHRAPGLTEDPGCGQLDDLKDGACSLRIEHVDGWPPCARSCAR